jgi:hypothetical protein
VALRFVGSDSGLAVEVRLGFLRALFDNKERCRRFVRSAYVRALGSPQFAAEDFARGTPDILTAAKGLPPREMAALYALWSFYVYRGEKFKGIGLTTEAFPFAMMPPSDALPALAEYVVYKMYPHKAVIERFRPQLNAALRACDPENKYLLRAIELAFNYVESDGQSGHPVTWVNELNKELLASTIKSSSS